VKIRRKALAKLRQAVERSEPTKVVEERIETTTLGMVEDLEREGQRLQRQQQEAANAGDYLQENILLEARIKLYRSLIGIRADLREMGEDRGRTIGREEFERMIRAMAGRAAKSIALACARFGEKLLGLTRMEQVVAILEPRLVQAMFLEPFAEAVHFKSEQNLPAWVEETIRRVCGNFIADGEAALDGALESRAA